MKLALLSPSHCLHLTDENYLVRRAAGILAQFSPTLPGRSLIPHPPRAVLPLLSSLFLFHKHTLSPAGDLTAPKLGLGQQVVSRSLGALSGSPSYGCSQNYPVGLDSCGLRPSPPLLPTALRGVGLLQPFLQMDKLRFCTVKALCPTYLPAVQSGSELRAV